MSTPINAAITVGGISTSNATYPCGFLNCKYGIFISNQCNLINVTKNEFTNCTSIGIYHDGQKNNSIKYSKNIFNDCLQGIFASRTTAPSFFSIDNNVFNKSSLSPKSSFSDAAIVVSNRASGPIRGNITSNIINDERIGIYTIGISNLGVSGNTVFFNRNIVDMQNEKHYGIWMEFCPNSTVTENRIVCTQTAVDPSTYKALVTGLNLKAFGNSSVSFNEINHCGTAMRFVDNCTYTYMQCNSMDNNGTGWFAQTLGGPVLSTQGNGTRELHNIWSNTPSSSTSFKVDGAGAPLPFDYYHSGLDVSTNDLSPNPYNSLILVDNPGLSPNLETCNAQFVNDSLNDQEVFNIYNDSIINVLSLDKIFSELYFKFYKYPDQRSTEQTDWMLDHQFTCGVYNQLFNDSINRESILDEFVNIPTSSYAKLNEKKDLFYRTLVNEIAGFDSLPYTGINLEELAWTNSWDGTEAVFLARAILGEEVDDQENNLRTAKNNLLTSECGNILLNNIGEIRNTQPQLLKLLFRI